MRSLLTLVVLLLAAGCGSSSHEQVATEEPPGLPLKSLCPGVHLVVDSLVVSDPTSRTVFADQLERLRAVAADGTSDALAPLIAAAATLHEVETNEDFFAARDELHAAVVEVDAACAAAGSPIQHSGPHPAG